MRNNYDPTKRFSMKEDEIDRSLDIAMAEIAEKLAKPEDNLPAFCLIPDGGKPEVRLDLARETLEKIYVALCDCAAYCKLWNDLEDKGEMIASDPTGFLDHCVDNQIDIAEMYEAKQYEINQMAGALRSMIEILGK